MAKHSKDWAKAPLTPEYLIDSGLLWEANRTIFHLLGVSLAVQRNEKGETFIAIKDFRSEPDKLVFDAATMIRGQEKLAEFMEAFGHKQIDKRAKKLGWACQPRKDTNGKAK